MIFRIRFAKYGVVKFIGHLDVMRYFQKAVRRSGLPIKYSQGFNPHQLMVFAQPLGVGVTSDGEYMDIETEDVDFDGNPLDTERVSAILGSALTEGFEIVEIREIPWQEGTKHPENAMSLINGADYMLSLKDGYGIYGSEPQGFCDSSASFMDSDAGEKSCLGKEKNDDEKSLRKEETDEKAESSREYQLITLREKLDEFLNRDSIVVSKKSKSGEKHMDIKPYIYEVSVTGNEDIPDFIEPKGVAHADIYEPGIRFFFRLSAGSAVNIKPELVAETFFEFIGQTYNPLAFQIHRIQMYRNVEAAEGL